MRVGLFVTCLVDLVRPRIGFAALKLLEAAGCTVIVPRTQTCCGQPGYNAGDYASARTLALKLIDEFRHCEYIVLPSGSCAGMIRVHYPKLFERDAVHRAAIEQLAARTCELTDFLTRVVKLERVPARFDGRLTYHDACSGLRELGVCQQPRELLVRAGAEVVEMSSATTCCGFGGTFSLKYGDISTRMAQNKCEAIARTGAGTVAAGDLGCLMNIEGTLRRRGDQATRVLHIAEVLAGDTD
jgi:L-lactate dehydrogenase complex protein LldE